MIIIFSVINLCNFIKNKMTIPAHYSIQNRNHHQCADSVRYCTCNIETMSSSYKYDHFKTYLMTVNLFYRQSSPSYPVVLLHSIPLHSLQAREHSKPYFLHPQRRDVQPLLQPQCMASRRYRGAGGRFVVKAQSLLSLTIHPQSSASRSTPCHCCTWWKTRRLWYCAAADVGGSVRGWTDSMLLDTFWWKNWKRSISSVSPACPR